MNAHLEMVPGPALLWITQKCIPLSPRVLSHDLTPIRGSEAECFVLHDLVYCPTEVVMGLKV